MSSVVSEHRVLSGMRPTGRLHLGHYHGVLKNWVKLQHEYECFFFVADWHALTTHYEDPSLIEGSVWEMVIDWLAAGLNPNACSIFLQSRVPEHAELTLLLSMMTPLSWLERVPTYKDQIEALKEKDLATYGFLGYPLMQSADILVYKAGIVPVGADQVSHIELTRDVARRFNHLYGREPGFEVAVENAIEKMGKKGAKLYRSLRKKYQEEGDEAALETAQEVVKEQQNISLGDKERLLGSLEGGGKVILPEPKVMLTPDSKMIGLDGQKMSKSYNNTIALRDSPEDIEKKIRTMPTDPARIRLTDAGDPQKCTVWQFHEVYSDDDRKAWVQKGCTSASIGCLDCKMPIIEAIKKELAPIQERAEEYGHNRDLVRSIINDGCEKARDEAKQTLEDVRAAMGLEYR